MADFIDMTNKEEVRIFRSTIPPMIDVLKAALAVGDEEAAQKGIEVFDELLLKVFIVPRNRSIFSLLFLLDFTMSGVLRLRFSRAIHFAH